MSYNAFKQVLGCQYMWANIDVEMTRLVSGSFTGYVIYNLSYIQFVLKHPFLLVALFEL